jgi:hypothetical protein
MNVAPSARQYRGYQEIEAAIRRFPVHHEKLWHVKFFVDELALMGLLIDENDDAGTAPANFRPATAGMAAKQLDELIKRANDLANKIDGKGNMTRARRQLARRIRDLNGPTITALSDAHSVIIGRQHFLLNFPYFLSELPKKLDDGREITSGELRFCADVAKSARSGALTGQSVGRPRDNRAHAVATLLAREYFNLTGNEPVFSVRAGGKDEGTVHGLFLELVQDIFRALRIKRDALSYASRAARLLRGRGRKK